MLHSNERMDLIIEYVTSYEEKIKKANKNGLFDSAKMFELFAIEICNIWFGQEFYNLNIETANYPYVDLISENKDILVQVSTTQDVPAKIKSTLEKIRDKKDDKYSTINNVVFFVLGNDSIPKIREYSGDNQIGSISFTIKDNLITTNNIITKAQNNLDFQKKLYKVLKDEYNNFSTNIKAFEHALNTSHSGLKSIEDLINGEYKIDRKEFIEKIVKDNERFISIQGEAGSGKSVLCKNYVENEKLVLYARAERFLEESNIDYIWNCCIQDVLKYINGKKLVIFEEDIYMRYINKRSDIVKLCLDYAKQEDKEDVIAVDACTIMEYYIEYSLEKFNQKSYYKIIDEISFCLEALYRMAKNCKEWLKEFFDTLINNYINEDKISRYDSKEIMEWTLKNVYPALVKELTNELCLIAETLWLRGKENIEKLNFYEVHRLSKEVEYGLSENAENYNYLYETVNENIFLWELFVLNFNEGFNWAIQFINKLVLEYEKNNPAHVIKIKVKISENNKIKEYLGNETMWLAGIRDYTVPTVIGDIIFCLKKVIINSLEVYKNVNRNFVAFSDDIKKTIYLKSNNIMLLTIIESIGMHFKNELPGYALDLATSIDLISWDIRRWMLYKKDLSKELMESHIFKTMGIFNYKDRYELDEKCNLSIQEYVFQAQVYFDLTIQNKCYEILDYLYSIVKNDAKNAIDYLQIQKMDIRNAKKTQITDTITMLEPQISGEAEKIVLREKELNKPNEKLNTVIKKCNDSIVSGQVNLILILETIEMLLNLMSEKDRAFQYEKFLIDLIAIAINQQELEKEKREKFCIIWINGIKKLFSNESFLAETKFTPILLNQLENNIAIEIKNKIKKIILDCLIYKGQHGIIREMSKYVKKYLANHEALAQSVFNTIIILSKDEMEHQKYNANYLKKSNKDKDFKFVPNMEPKLSRVDYYIKSIGGKCYVSCKEDIIDKYLFKEDSLEINVFDMNNYDISTICYVANCGLNFVNESFRKVIHEILLCMIDIWNYTKENNNAYNIFDGYQKYEIIELFQREIVQAPKDEIMAIDMLFEKIDFTKFTTDTIKFYQDILGAFLCEFFYSYVDLKRRKRCKKKILDIERKVNNINEEYVQRQLYKSLMLSVTRFYKGDWSKIKTTYKYSDKQFLNDQFTKYGKYYIEELLETIYQMHIDKLLPEILISIRNSFQSAKSDIYRFEKSIRNQKVIVQWIILKSFIMYSDTIKQDQELTEAYEDILEILIKLNNEQAAVILDEFRIH